MQDGFDLIRESIRSMLQVTILAKGDDDKIHRYRTTFPDAIIADAIVYERSGSIEKIDEELTKFLDLGKYYLDQQQYEVLRRVFAYLKAYKEESLVLESMVSHNVARTEDQERRLVFLRNNMASLLRSKDSLDHELNYDESEGKLVYDYRSITWTDEQVKGYFDRLSGEDKTAHNVLVAAEWLKNLNIQGEIKWNIKQVAGRIATCLDDNFGDYIACELVEASSLSGEYLEYDDVIYISEKAGSTSRNPWLSFIVSAEQMTKRQISVSVYALYNPENDFLSISDVIERNRMTAAKFLSIKNKQNPKVNNYIYTMQSLIIEELEKYINSRIDSGSIY